MGKVLTAFFITALVFIAIFYVSRQRTPNPNTGTFLPTVSPSNKPVALNKEAKYGKKKIESLKDDVENYFDKNEEEIIGQLNVVTRAHDDGEIYKSVKKAYLLMSEEIKEFKVENNEDGEIKKNMEDVLDDLEDYAKKIPIYKPQDFRL